MKLSTGCAYSVHKSWTTRQRIVSRETTLVRKEPAMLRRTAIGVGAVLMLCSLMLVNQPAAQAVTWYCDSHVRPVTVSPVRTGEYTVKITTSSPLNSTAAFYEEPTTAGPETLIHSAHDAAGTAISWTFNTTSPAYYVIKSTGDSGQVWVDESGNPLTACFSPNTPVS